MQVVRIEELHLLVRTVRRTLLLRKVAADEWVKWSWEEASSEPELRCVDGLGLEVCWLRRGRWNGWRRGNVGLVVAVRGGDDDLELLAILALVRSGRGVDVAAPECALEGGHRVWVRAVVAPDRGSGVVDGRAEGWVTFGVDVERGAELGAVALVGTLGDVVLLQRV